jgi:hypothetical protein
MEAVDQNALFYLEWYHAAEIAYFAICETYKLYFLLLIGALTRQVI